MASYEYRVVLVVEGVRQPMTRGDARGKEPGTGWTHDTAARFAIEGDWNTPGIRIEVDRRRGRGEWMAHRRYEVTEGLTVRRTDR